MLKIFNNQIGAPMSHIPTDSPYQPTFVAMNSHSGLRLYQCVLPTNYADVFIYQDVYE